VACVSTTETFWPTLPVKWRPAFWPGFAVVNANWLPSRWVRPSTSFVLNAVRSTVPTREPFGSTSSVHDPLASRVCESRNAFALHVEDEFPNALPSGRTSDTATAPQVRPNVELLSEADTCWAELLERVKRAF
jgi:hypothetical protein